MSRSGLQFSRKSAAMSRVDRKIIPSLPAKSRSLQQKCRDAQKKSACEIRKSHASERNSGSATM
jgi:hypothetical protein